MEYQLNIGIQNCKNEKISIATFCLLAFFASIRMSNNFFSKIIAPIVVKFYMKHDQTPGFQNYKIGSGQESKMATVTEKNQKQQNQLLLQNHKV